MQIRKHIPNIFTLGNLFSGTLATIFAVQGKFELTASFVLLGVFLDFFDGFFARILNVTGELGKQLDSLADMVTSGVVPGIVMYQLLNIHSTYSIILNDEFEIGPLISFIGLFLTLSACYRLAKFNIDTRQSESFVGLPTPAMSLFVVFLPLIYIHSEYQFLNELLSNQYVLIGLTLVLGYLMNAELVLFSLKFKNFNLKNNTYKYILLVLSIVLILVFTYVSVPMIIISYVILSLIKNVSEKKIN